MIIIILAATIGIPLVAKGNATLFDLISLFILPVSFNYLFKRNELRRFVLAAISLSLLQFISDIVHGTKLFTVPQLFGVQIICLLAALYYLQDRFNINWLKIVLGVSFGCAVIAIISKAEFLNVWKYALSTPLTIALYGFLTYINARKVYGIIAGMLIVSICFINDFRTGIFASIFYLLNWIRVSNSTHDVQGLKISSYSLTLRPITFAATFAIFVSLLYPWLASSGALGQRAQYQEDVLKENTNIGNFLLFARQELPQNLFLAAKSPILGLGSYGEPPHGHVIEALDFVDRKIAPLSENSRKYLMFSYKSKLGYSNHSQLGASLVYSGFGALIYWFVFFNLLYKNWALAFKERSISTPFFSYLLFMGLWDSLFSGFSSFSRIQVVLIVFCLSQTSSQIRKKQR